MIALLKELTSLPERLTDWMGRLPLPALALLGVVVAGVVGGGGYYAYRTYDYVQHDNEFCLSCHLMQDPFQRFARSAHRGLGCKACHQPNIITRARMALTQIVENPDSLASHAEVPNDRCASCHIQGDPKRWEIISNTVGHKIHLESEDSTLQGLECVECHSASIHEFVAEDRTCGQAGCHADTEIKLAGMSRLNVHCAACHNFTAPVPDTSSAALEEAAILPDRGECLSCHAMRDVVTLPQPDPHKGNCAACHNPHRQEGPEAAAQSCTAAGCHTRPDTLTAFHRGLEPGVLEDCEYCHKAHDFKVDGNDCLACHQGILNDSDVVPRRGGFHRSAEVRTSGGRRRTPFLDRARALLHAPHPLETTLGIGIGFSALPSLPVQERVEFRHSRHRDVACTQCHQTRETHGGLTVRTTRDCRSCHHEKPEAEPCTRCHEPSQEAGRVFVETRTLVLSVGKPRARDLPFNHADHEDPECSQCHGEGLDMKAAAVDCGSCHDDHHREDAACVSCHEVAPESAHPLEVHEGCGGSGCHDPAPFQGAPWTREICVSCHRGQANHKPAQGCVSCHPVSDYVGAAP